MTIGEKIAKLRKENNLTQEQLANKLGVSRQTIYSWEKDEVSPAADYLKALALEFNVSVDYLLGIDESKPQVLTVEDYKKDKKTDAILRAVEGASWLLIVIIYLIMGFTANLWHPGWIIFIVGAIINIILDVIINIKNNKLDEEDD